MTRQEIMRMAREAGFTNPERFETDDENLRGILEDFWVNLERFAALVAAAEREAFVKACEDMEEKAEGTECCKWPTPVDCAYAIRASGNHD